MPASPATYVLASLLGVAALSLVALHATSAGQDALLRRAHLRPASVAEWTALQPLPGMYNFQNRAWASRKRIAWERLDESDAVQGGEYYNHYPTRMVTFLPTRAPWGHVGCSDFLYVESRVRGRSLRSRFRIDRQEGGSLTMQVDRQSGGSTCRR
ncbi:MAG: hypothetical protein AAF845_05860 [Bacteroidota bacterium]